jgi:hypothetical protein
MRSRLVCKTFCLLIAVSAGLFAASAKTVKRYKSPDGTLTVAVMSISGEAIVKVEETKGNVVSKKDFTSDDNEHGYYVAKAQWTPDSQFFVYSLESSGGHSVMTINTMVFSRLNNQTEELGNLLNNTVIFPDFSIIAPDKVKVTIQSPERAVIVSLSQLLKKKSPTKSK